MVSNIRQVCSPRAPLSPGTPGLLSVSDTKTPQWYKYIVLIQWEMPTFSPNVSAIQLFNSEIKGSILIGHNFPLAYSVAHWLKWVTIFEISYIIFTVSGWLTCITVGDGKITVCPSEILNCDFIWNLQNILTYPEGSGFSLKKTSRIFQIFWNHKIHKRQQEKFLKMCYKQKENKEKHRSNALRRREKQSVADWRLKFLPYFFFHKRLIMNRYINVNFSKEDRHIHQDGTGVDCIVFR